ncbi:MAG: metalloregulator ArsR/SmtB family transcription factor [Nitrospinota bacterium]|nr:metalloregulator ArsR/SmtB family transcription factor [Nitrospinota bacterium]MDH5679564.1 metalloregulator ArsR/SmtB family transcription factor [Nitrospinota bacterium]MDH5755150.1 metalloregulator ArsR/SmtB family transcription factor [Nitrospinota bacterium]
MKDETVCEVNLVDKENVDYVKGKLSAQTKALKVAEFFKTLSDPARMRIIEALSIRKLCVCDLAHLLGLSQSATSHHLRTLRDKGVVKYEKTGKIVYYRLDDEHVKGAFSAVLDHVLHQEVDRAP